MPGTGAAGIMPTDARAAVRNSACPVMRTRPLISNRAYREADGAEAGSGQAYRVTRSRCWPGLTSKSPEESARTLWGRLASQQASGFPSLLATGTWPYAARAAIRISHRYPELAPPIWRCLLGDGNSHDGRDVNLSHLRQYFATFVPT